MKTDNLNPPLANANARTRGHIGALAGSPGMIISDAEGNAVVAPEARFIGAHVYGQDSDLAFVVVSGSGNQVTNNSGGFLDYGDVVVLQTDGTITTTTTPQDTRPVGVIQQGGEDGDEISAQFAGFVGQVNTTGSVAAGDYLETSGTAGRARSGGTVRRNGSFAQALSAGPNPSALLFGVADAASVSVTGTTAGAVVKIMGIRLFR